MFKPVPSKVDFVTQELEILDFWKESEAFKKLQTIRKGGQRWSFIDGPITANNPMGVHHGWGRTYKDLFHRFKAMQGHRARYQNGFDCQGLWVEVNVEREMGFKSKRDIEAFGLADFVILCKQRVLKYAAIQTEQSIRLGYWMDWNDTEFLRQLSVLLGEEALKVISVEGPFGGVEDTVENIIGRLGLPELGGSYFTFSDENNYTIWSVLKSCHDRGWIYKGRDVMPWCARCGTGLSQHEIVTEGYQEITHPSITLRFPLKDKDNESLLIWTTTPWTLTSNVAAAVGPGLTYVRARQGEEVFYLSKGTLHMLKGEYEILDELLGESMKGWKYSGPFDELPAQINSGAPEKHQIILWDEVGEQEGTGIVHIAPGCGAEDFELGKEYNLPIIAPLDESGVFIEGFNWLTGLKESESAQPIFENLTQKGRTYKIEDYTHRYPVCWRCGEELVFRLVDEWFISMGDQIEKPYDEVTEDEKSKHLRYQIMEVVINETEWYPSFGLERELDWLNNMHDWMISKKRYWGLALPIWECHACGNFDLIGSKEELRQRAVQGWEAFEGHSPHRPFIDEVKICCSQCGERISRIPDVGNPWLDAGIVGMSTLQYNSNREFWKAWYPADFISESFPGQFRNWFYSLLAMSTILERKAPFKEVFTYATLLAEDGRAMHKSWGNAIEFNEAADEMGVDVMRWLFCSYKPEKDLLFGYHGADQVRRQFMIPLWNVYSFFVTYANIDGWSPKNTGNPRYSSLDLWILSGLQQTIREVTHQLDVYEPDVATKIVNDFLDDLSNWYLRRSRRRFWAKAGASYESDEDKHAAYSTLYNVLVTLIKLIAPFVPFVSEVIYQNLVRSMDEKAPESVHHCLWPEPDSRCLNEELTKEMALVMRLVSLGHGARNKSGLKVRQPLSEAAFGLGSHDEGSVVERYAEVIREELNVKKVRLLDATSEAVNYQLKPLPKQLGQKYGSRFPDLRKAILALNAEDASHKFFENNSVQVELEGEWVEILPEEVEVLVEAHEGFSVAAEGPYLAALVTELSHDLIVEGLAREVVRRIQDLRKQADLSVDDRIRLQYSASPRLQEAIALHRNYIESETLAIAIYSSRNPTGDAVIEHEFDGESLTIALIAQKE
ncbi:MAG: isoleucine--tRNA ligase [Chloroflexi bacterium RBG_16_48_8]|nr:MAG: isoleucine--tRNA ligase [Chloroflexi bacterium RBG_16_48_8]